MTRSGSVPPLHRRAVCDKAEAPGGFSLQMCSGVKPGFAVLVPNLLFGDFSRHFQFGHADAVIAV
jgi:hypothetical protein